jgi:hypothetical protein
VTLDGRGSFGSWSYRQGAEQVNEVLIVVGVVVATMGVMAVWVWVLGRIEARDQRREDERPRDAGPPGVGGVPRHMRRGGRHGRRGD